jgi:hypothetical protein
MQTAVQRLSYTPSQPPTCNVLVQLSDQLSQVARCAGHPGVLGHGG